MEFLDDEALCSDDSPDSVMDIDPDSEVQLFIDDSSLDEDEDLPPNPYVSHYYVLFSF